MIAVVPEPCFLMSGELPAAVLFVHVDDVLHQQVPLQSINTVPVQDHLMATGRAAETTS